MRVYEIQGNFFSKTSTFRINTKQENVFLSSIPKKITNQMKSSSTLVIPQMENIQKRLQCGILSLWQGINQQILLLIRRKEDYIQQDYMNYFQNCLCLHTQCNLAQPINEQVYIEADSNDCYLNLSTIKDKNVKVYKLWPRTNIGGKFQSIKPRFHKQNQIVIHYSNQNMESNQQMSDGFIIYDINKEIISHQYKKNRELISKKSIQFDNNLLVVAYLKNDNSSYLRSYDIRTRDEGFIIDTSHREHQQNPNWTPNYSFFDRTGCFDIATIWGQPGLRDCSINYLDIRKPFSARSYPKLFHHIKFFSKKSPMPNADSCYDGNSFKTNNRLWIVQNVFENYKYTGNRVSCFQDIE